MDLLVDLFKDLTQEFIDGRHDRFRTIGLGEIFIAADRFTVTDILV